MPQVTFSDWSGGEFGQLGPTGCKDNQWTGLNVMVYKDGSIGPRPGITALTTSTVTGVVWAMRGVGTPTAGQASIVYGQNKLIKSFLLNYAGGQGTLQTVGTVSVTVTLTTQMIQTGPGLGVVPIYGDQVYGIASYLGVAAVNPLAGSPPGKVATSYGVRIMVGNTPTAPNRVYYSAAMTTTAFISVSFGATNFFDVGIGGWPITTQDETRQRLTIATEAGEFWGLSGTPGVNDVLRRQPRGDLAPSQWYHSTRISESIWFAPLGEDFPCEFTGSTVDKLRYRYLRFAQGAAPDMFVASIPQQETAIFYEVGPSNRAAMLCNGAWSYHTFGAATRFASPMSTGGSGQDYDQPMITTDGGSASAVPNFYAFRPALDRPGKTSDVYASPGDLSTTPLTANLSTRYWWAPNDKDITVTEVTIDGFTWNTGSSTNNNVDVQVRSLFRFGDVAYMDSALSTGAFSQSPSATTSDRQDARFRVTNPGAAGAQGFQIILTNLKGFAVRRIRVLYTETARR